MFSNSKDAKGIFEKKSIIFVIYVKDSQVGQERIRPKEENIIPVNPKIKIKMVIGAKNGTIKILAIGEIRGI